jgi:hypothetical protein
MKKKKKDYWGFFSELEKMFKFQVATISYQTPMNSFFIPSLFSQDSGQSLQEPDVHTKLRDCIWTHPSAS